MFIKFSGLILTSGFSTIDALKVLASNLAAVDNPSDQENSDSEAAAAVETPAVSIGDVQSIFSELAPKEGTGSIVVETTAAEVERPKIIVPTAADISGLPADVQAAIQESSRAEVERVTADEKVEEGKVAEGGNMNNAVVRVKEGAALAFGAPEYVFCRHMADSYVSAIQMEKNDIDLELAKRQHETYVSTLRGLGIRVIDLDADEGCPDCVFIEDPAIVISPECVVTTCPGAMSRRPEVSGVRSGLEKNSIKRIRAMPVSDNPSAEITMDGGDVMRVGRIFYVGVSSRSTPQGIQWLTEQLAQEGMRVVPVQVKGGLHLKSAVVVLDESTLLVESDKLDTKPFLDAGLTLIEADEPAGANVLAFGENVIMSSAAPKTIAAVQALDRFNVMVLDVSEVHKADGALTCCSLRVPREGQWCI